ncbi:MAG: preprotein translocase subunit SecY, partial [Candidatus Diapherotrites archaeon]|nr:preprotein translocase subunit SecY [Candidatus Diapherotrites archaeon]
PGMFLVVALQIALGSIILIYLDEVVSKYGIGSGIGLFIAGGVAGAFFWQVFAPPINLANHPELAQGGLLASFLYSVTAGNPRFLILLPILIAVLLFLIIVFMEGVHVNIPLSIGRKGFGGRFPVKLLYVSNLPVIFASVLFVNVKMFASALERITSSSFVSGFFKMIETAVTPPYNLFYTLIEKLGAEGLNALPYLMPQLIHATVFMILLIITCVIFGVFWVQFAGQGPEAIAEQLQSSGMYIPGFRRDKRIIQKVLEKYIPSITVLGSILVALLAGFGDMTLGTLATGTGILLTVGIVYRMYEELARAQLMEMHPLLSKLLGGK